MAGDAASGSVDARVVVSTGHGDLRRWGDTAGEVGTSHWVVTPSRREIRFIVGSRSDGRTGALPSPTVNEPVDAQRVPTEASRRRCRRRVPRSSCLIGAGVLMASGGGGDDRLGTVDMTTTTTSTVPPTTTTHGSADDHDDGRDRRPRRPPRQRRCRRPRRSWRTASRSGRRTRRCRRSTAVAALTGLPADEALTRRPILAVKIDNYSRARPQWGLDAADAIIEENVEGRHPVRRAVPHQPARPSGSRPFRAHG